jgi:UDP-N-acetylmuramate dehydrogenase
MAEERITSKQMDRLQARYGDRLKKDADVARFTSLRVGGPASGLITVQDREELEDLVRFVWKHEIPYLMLGGGSNLLISEAGVPCLVILNRAKAVDFRDRDEGEPVIWAESGASLGVIARRAANRGWSGLEWAAGIPGTIGGAVVGNAGAHGSDMSANLIMAEILHQSGQKVEVEKWTAEDLDYRYRSSRIKGGDIPAVVLTAELQLRRSTPQAVKDEMQEYAEYRERTQPVGASAGSMFKNPSGHYAGALIDQAGLKGTRIGGAEISPLHGNFFINRGDASAADIYALIQKARREVAEQFGVDLELEITLEGDWSEVVGNDR